MTLRRRTVLSMLSVVAISGGVCTLIGGHLLWRYLGREAENRVQQDLNAAWVRASPRPSPRQRQATWPRGWPPSAAAPRWTCCTWQTPRAA